MATTGVSNAKQQLAAILRRAKLKRQEQEAFEHMWDALHRYGRLSDKQKAWIEKVYFEQKLDRDVPVQAEPAKKASQSGTHRLMGVKSETAQKAARVGYINYPGIQSQALITNMDTLHQLCPRIRPGSPQYKRIKAFFDNGGVVLKVKPIEEVA